MARDYLSIASAPYDEDCVQVTDKKPYLDDMRAECRRFLELVRKKLGSEPPGAQLAIKSFPHDFGTYLEVVCLYDDENEAASRYAFHCESDAPRTWDDDKPLVQTPSGEEEVTVNAVDGDQATAMG